MAPYNFKHIPTVPDAKQFVDIVLSRCTRTLPTKIHKQFPITRIRSMYARRIRFVAQQYADRLAATVAGFPLIDAVHPFWASMMNNLYHRDHYKLALARLTSARHLVLRYARDYVRLLHYAKNAFRCKQLKRAAFGIMCAIVRRLDDSLQYLELVRRHLSRMPALDPFALSLVLCGFPNVGKSSLMNKLTHADVEVHCYPGTTKALHLGHYYHTHHRFQVIDSPGILDRPLEARGPMEMQSITALAHLDAAVVFLVDVSEEAVESVEAQVRLFLELRPLYAGKPVYLALSKVDLCAPDALATPARAHLERARRETGAVMLGVSALVNTGVSALRAEVSERMLQSRRAAVAAAEASQGRPASRRLALAGLAGLEHVHVAVPRALPGQHRTPHSLPPGVVAACARRSGERSMLAHALILSGMADGHHDGVAPHGDRTELLSSATTDPERILASFAHELSSSTTTASSLRHRIAIGALDAIIASVRGEHRRTRLVAPGVVAEGKDSSGAVAAGTAASGGSSDEAGSADGDGRPASDAHGSDDEMIWGGDADMLAGSELKRLDDDTASLYHFLIAHRHDDGRLAAPLGVSSLGGPRGARQLEVDRARAAGCTYRTDMRQWWDLPFPEQTRDIIPLIKDGKLIADFVAPDALERLDVADRAEAARERAAAARAEADRAQAFLFTLGPDQQRTYDAVVEQQQLIHGTALAFGNPARAKITQIDRARNARRKITRLRAHLAAHPEAGLSAPGVPGRAAADAGVEPRTPVHMAASRRKHTLGAIRDLPITTPGLQRLDALDRAYERSETYSQHVRGRAAHGTAALAELAARRSSDHGGITVPRRRHADIPDTPLSARSARISRTRTAQDVVHDRTTATARKAKVHTEENPRWLHGKRSGLRSAWR